MVMLIFRPNSPRLLSETSASAIPCGEGGRVHLHRHSSTRFTSTYLHELCYHTRKVCLLGQSAGESLRDRKVSGGYSTRVLIRDNMCCYQNNNRQQVPFLVVLLCVSECSCLSPHYHHVLWDWDCFNGPRTEPKLFFVAVKNEEQGHEYTLKGIRLTV